MQDIADRRETSTAGQGLYKLDVASRRNTARALGHSSTERRVDACTREERRGGCMRTFCSSCFAVLILPTSRQGHLTTKENWGTCCNVHLADTSPLNRPRAIPACVYGGASRGPRHLRRHHRKRTLKYQRQGAIPRPRHQPRPHRPGLPLVTQASPAHVSCWRRHCCLQLSPCGRYPPPRPPPTLRAPCAASPAQPLWYQSPISLRVCHVSA